MTTHEMSQEASRKFGKAILAELGVDTHRVRADSLSLERIGESGKVVVTWEGAAWMDFTRVQEIMAEAWESEVTEKSP